MYDLGVGGCPIIIYRIRGPRYHRILYFAFVVLSNCPANIIFMHWVHLWSRRVTLSMPSSKQ